MTQSILAAQPNNPFPENDINGLWYNLAITIGQNPAEIIKDYQCTPVKSELPGHGGNNSKQNL